MLVYSYLYSVPYIVLMFLFFLLAVQESNKNSHKYIIYMFDLFLFTLFFGTANYIGPDVFSYNDLFDLTPSLFELHISDIEFVEPGYLTFVSLVKTIWNNFHFFIFVSTLIDAILLLHIFKRFSPNVSLSFVVLIVMSLFLEISLYRNMKAILIFLLGMQYIQQQKLWKYMLVLLLACSFHLSAFLFFSLYFFLNRNCFWMFIVLFVLGLVVYIGNFDVSSSLIVHLPLGDKYLTYLNSIHGEPLNFSMGTVERICMAVLILCIYRKYLNSIKHLLFFNSFMCYFFLSFFFWDIGIVAARGSMLFQYSYWFIIPMLLYNYNFHVKILFMLAFLSFSILKLSSATKGIIYRYESCLMYNVSSRYERSSIFNTYRYDLFNY